MPSVSGRRNGGDGAPGYLGGLSGGSSENTEPEAGATLTTLASCQSMTFKPLLFNATGRPSDARIEHVVATAVRTFLAAYRR